ncbi:ATP-grasp domain-containing protein [Nocardiopsis sp. YSL2]|uniref:preATP grasp domain-containing protein n=1 Tax=Nocardiopsis sp. YSL2 TaxID=2939492 RepID=UPI0026F435D0|nr:ATP-grasp domain-containing protein [Nocardiopsis sp. YSL2]
MSTFAKRLKSAVADGPESVLVFLGNIEVEEQWARGEAGLPTLSSQGARALTHRMDEFALLLGEPTDHVLLKTAPDPDFHSYLVDYGLARAQVHAVGAQQTGRTVTKDVLEDPDTLALLKELGREGAYLAPHGVSDLEQEVAERCGLRLATSPADLCKRVNSKLFSRRLADRLRIRQPEGMVCETPEELAEAVEYAEGLLAQGRTVVAKDAFGVSGKGVMVVEEQRRLAWLRRTVERAHSRSGKLGLILEEWISKDRDLNYQVIVAKDGSVAFDFVKEAITENGVHKGHRIPAGLTPGHEAEIRDAGLAIGRALADEGYRGVVGIDALLGTDGRAYPLTEINARYNMSTYQAALQEVLMRDHSCAEARQYPLRLNAPLPFAVLRRELDHLMVASPGDPGIVINNFATVNAVGGPSKGREHFDGRLYAFLVGPDPESVSALDHRLGRILADIEKGEVSRA